MSSKYQQFIFEDYRFDAESKELKLSYSLDGELKFTEIYRFTFDFAENYAVEAFTRACELLFLVAGVSYYKTYLPAEIVIKTAQVDQKLKDFLDNTYQRGLGEFFYVNNLNPRTEINFPVTADEIKPIIKTSNQGLLVGIGGGKDSLVSVEMLKSQPKVATWSLNHRPQLEPLVERIGLPHFWVERQWDKQLLELNTQDAYNGHVPISAIFACVGSVVAILSEYQDVIVSNESSASEPNLTHQGVDINHQYSKSLQFEQEFQAVLAHTVAGSVRYYSFLRPLSELHIAELFGKNWFAKYHDVFSSCNRAFTHESNHIFWDGSCPKCAFVFLALTPFIERPNLEALFGGKNILLDPTLAPTYRQLLGIEGAKPLECVGEVKESRAAMRLAQAIYPELATYDFELPEDYDFRALSTHSMPTEMFSLLRSVVQPE